MLYSFVRIDKPGTAALRLNDHSALGAYLFEVQERFGFAGPLLADDRATMKGSPLVIDFDSRERTQSSLAQVPFMNAGRLGSVSMQASVSLRPQRAGFPA